MINWLPVVPLLSLCLMAGTDTPLVPALRNELIGMAARWALVVEHGRANVDAAGAGAQLRAASAPTWAVEGAAAMHPLRFGRVSLVRGVVGSDEYVVLVGAYTDLVFRMRDVPDARDRARRALELHGFRAFKEFCGAAPEDVHCGVALTFGTDDGGRSVMRLLGESVVLAAPATIARQFSEGAITEGQLVEQGAVWLRERDGSDLRRLDRLE